METISLISTQVWETDYMCLCDKQVTEDVTSGLLVQVTTLWRWFHQWTHWVENSCWVTSLKGNVIHSEL